MIPIHNGIDVLLQDPAQLHNARIALLTNYASMTRGGARTADALADVCKIVRILAPEHGFWGDVAYLEDVDGDRYREIPVESLYGTKSQAALAPKPEQLRDVDALIVDLQDVGARYYTYAATLGNCMAVAAQTRTRVIVLDRPNPITGRDVEGNVNIAAPYRSFVGQYPLPIRHALTMGELAEYINTQQTRCDLQVIRMRSWKRWMFWDETGLNWVHTSPNMATPDTALVYPGMCLFEGTNVSEGRGTVHPFELIGAPWLDEHRLADTLNLLGLENTVLFQPFCFRPAFNKHKEERCHGVFLRVVDRNAFRPVRTAMLMLKVIRDLGKSQFKWYDGFYEFATVLAIDALTGSSEFRDAVDRGTIHDVAEWIDLAEERRMLIEGQRQSVLFTEYDETPRAVVTTIIRGATDVPSVMDAPRAEA